MAYRDYSDIGVFWNIISVQFGTSKSNANKKNQGAKISTIGVT